MKTLPARGIAGWLSTIAMVGCAVSLAVNVFALLGFYSKSMMDFAECLFIGMFPVLIPAGLANERLLSEFSFRDRMFRMFNPMLSLKVTWRLLSKAPNWFRAILIVLLINALAQAQIVTFHPSSVSQAEKLMLFSAAAAMAYSAAATILASYARSEHPILPEEV